MSAPEEPDSRAASSRRSFWRRFGVLSRGAFGVTLTVLGIVIAYTQASLADTARQTEENRAFVDTAKQCADGLTEIAATVVKTVFDAQDQMARRQDIGLTASATPAMADLQRVMDATDATCEMGSSMPRGGYLDERVRVDVAGCAEAVVAYLDDGRLPDGTPVDWDGFADFLDQRLTTIAAAGDDVRAIYLQRVRETAEQ